MHTSYGLFPESREKLDNHPDRIIDDEEVITEILNTLILQ